MNSQKNVSKRRQRRSLLSSTLTLSSMLMLVSGFAHAEAIQWTEAEGGNGHWYEVVEEELSWFQASDLAAASGGHLISITSAGENQMLCNAGLPDTAGRPYWTCGVRQGGSWSWENGDSWGYTNWDGIEPNGCCSYGGYAANYLVWRPWHNVATCGWDDTNPFHCSDDPGCTPRTLIEYSADCNDDGIVDYGQILDGTFEDTNGNGVPDCCDEGTPCDGAVSHDPVQWSGSEGGNGHWYQVITMETGFPAHHPEAYFELAESLGGYAVAITSLEEDLFVYELSTNIPGAWEPGPGFGPVLGGRSTGNCDFWWVNGEPWSYTSWGPADPGCNGEYIAYCICGQSSPNETERWWIDADPSYGGMKSGVIEWSADCNGDGIVDYGQILDGTYEDLDSNGVPDCCDADEPCDQSGEIQLLNVAQWTTQEGGNGHWYGLVDLEELPSVSAEEHFLIAESFGGHTATMGSAAENQFCYDRHGGESAMIGVRKVSGTNQGAWITGEPWQYSNWHSGEGNNSWERYAVHWAQDGNPSSQWQDTDLSSKRYSIIEWEADCNGDGIVDYGQILDGMFADANGNGVPDCCDDGESCECSSDVDNDGEVNVNDVLIVIAEWGTSNPLGDPNGDGIVDVQDVLQVLSDYGMACP